MSDRFHDAPRRGFIDVVIDLAQSAPEDGLPIGEIVDRLDERAFALVILLLAVPCILPGIPGPPQVFGPIVAFLAAQMAFGRRELWLPKNVMRRRVKKAWIDGMARFADRRLRWLERLARPRLSFVVTGPGERLVALVMVVAAITMIPPVTHSAPALALSLMSVGILQRDGLFAIFGAILAVSFLALMTAFIIGLVLGARFAMEFLNDHLPWLAHWLSRR